MRTKTLKPNGSKVKGESFKSILNKMMKLTNNGNLRTANQSWDIYKSVNNSNYNNPIGA